MRRDVYKPLGSMIDHFMNQSLSEVLGSDFSLNRPDANIIEKNDSFIIELAVPGMSKDDIKMEVIKDQLIISANVENESTDESKSFKRREFNYHTFKRNFNLSSKVNKEDISATCDNGILIVTVAKKEEAVEKGPISIEVK